MIPESESQRRAREREELRMVERNRSRSTNMKRYFDNLQDQADADKAKRSMPATATHQTDH